MLNREDIRFRLLVHVRRKYGKQKAAAEALGVTEQYLSAVINGHKPISRKLLNEIGCERVIGYRERSGEVVNSACGVRAP